MRAGRFPEVVLLRADISEESDPSLGHQSVGGGVWTLRSYIHIYVHSAM
jgi:hypothetical protein